MPEVEEPKQPRYPTEAERVVTNVEYHLREMGFNTMQAEALAKAHVDWHRALRADPERLLARGGGGHPLVMCNKVCYGTSSSR